MKAIDAWVIEQIKLLTDPKTGGDFDRLYDVCQTFQIDNGHDAIIAAIDEVAKVLLGMKDDCLPALKRVILKQKEAAQIRNAAAYTTAEKVTELFLLAGKAASYIDEVKGGAVKAYAMRIVAAKTQAEIKGARKEFEVFLG